MEPERLENLEFPGASLDWGADYYLLSFDRPLRFLSSAPLGEGYLDASWVLSLQVPGDACFPEPEEYLIQQARSKGIPVSEGCIGLLTAVYHQDLQVYTVREQGVTVTTLATVGVTNASSPAGSCGHSPIGTSPETASPGLPRPEDTVRPGTINTVTLINAELTPGAMVRASTIATEAKTLALMESSLKTSEGHPATGTSTDATVVGHTGEGIRFRYAGSATLAGKLVSHATYHAVRQGLEAFIKRKYPERKYPE